MHDHMNVETDFDIFSMCQHSSALTLLLVLFGFTTEEVLVVVQ